VRGISLRLGAALAVAVLGVAGCGDDDTVSTDDSEQTTTVPGSTTSAAVTTTSIVDDVQLLIVLNQDGIGFTTENSGSVSRVDFGSDQKLTRDTVVKSLGTPVEELTQPQCGQGTVDVSRWDDITLTFQDGLFVGWDVSRGSTLTTADGIGLGSTLDELESSIGAAEMVENSTLGREFTAGEYWGLLDETDDVVDFLSSGVICVFR
jgi:hypothetical protein